MCICIHIHSCLILLRCNRSLFIGQEISPNISPMVSEENTWSRFISYQGYGSGKGIRKWDLAELGFVGALGMRRVKVQTLEEEDRFPGGANGADAVCAYRGFWCLKRIEITR